MRKYELSTPFTRPATAPLKRHTTKPTIIVGQLSPPIAPISLAPITPDITSTEPTERSSPPALRTYVPPTPMIRKLDVAIAILRILKKVRKASGRSIEKMVHNSNRVESDHAVGDQRMRTHSAAL